MSSQPPAPSADRLVIGIAGRIGAGKTSAGEYLRSTHGFQYLRYSLVLSDWLAKDPESKTHLQEIGWKVMAGGMQSELNRRLIAQVLPSSDVAVDGLRHPTDYEHLTNSFGSSFHLVYIHSAFQERWSRLKRRYTTIESFRGADSHPVEQQIDTLRPKAALVIKNDGALDDLQVALNDAVLEFRRESKE